MNLLFRLTQALNSGDAEYWSGAKHSACTTCSKELSVAGRRPIRHGLVKCVLHLRFNMLSIVPGSPYDSAAHMAQKYSGTPTVVMKITFSDGTGSRLWPPAYTVLTPLI